MKSWLLGHNREVTRMKVGCDRCTRSKQTQARQKPQDREERRSRSPTHIRGVIRKWLLLVDEVLKAESLVGGLCSYIWPHNHKYMCSMNWIWCVLFKGTNLSGYVWGFGRNFGKDLNIIKIYFTQFSKKLRKINTTKN